MKKIFLFLALILFVLSSFSQSGTNRIVTKADYLRKSKQQKKTAWIFLGGGAALWAASFLIPRGGLVQEGVYCGPGAGILCNEEYKNDGVKSAFFITGGLSALGSIPFFIASGKNKRRATEVAIRLHNQKIFVPLQNKSVPGTQPALMVTIEW